MFEFVAELALNAIILLLFCCCFNVLEHALGLNFWQPVSVAKIDFARVLIREFAKECAVHYGEDGLTFNLHAHLHLCDQVERNGRLYWSDCFPFEGWFKSCKALFSGTTNLPGQIALLKKAFKLLELCVATVNRINRIIFSHLYSPFNSIYKVTPQGNKKIS